MKLLVGYGNTMRRDDGVGWLVAGQLAPVVRVITAHQLMPEIAYEVAHAGCVVFVDASIEGNAGDVQTRVLHPLDRLEDAHALTPPGILYLAGYLYDRMPPAHLVTITGETFDLGDTLSGTVQAAVPQAIDAICQLLDVPRPPRETGA